MTKISQAQRNALLCVRRHAGRSGTFMPYADQARSFEACARKELLIYRHYGEPGIAESGYELTAAGAAAIADDTPDHLKLGYDHHRERDRIRAHLRRRIWRFGLDRFAAMRLEQRIDAIQARIAKNRPTLKERQATWLARQPKTITATLTVEEWQHLADLFAGANDPISASIGEKAKRITGQ
jgi:hypothetical protein